MHSFFIFNLHILLLTKQNLHFVNKMPQPCAVDICKRKSRALCHCCSKNLCIDHLKEYQDLYNSQLNTFLDEINTIDDQLSPLNVD
jgi:hypothetical protein